jgi:excinuclease ABC subunit A
MDTQTIVVRGAREHNLQNVSLELPRNRLIVFTGVSGSGKSSLAFDTLYAEGQRRYVESLSAYARQFLGQLQKPDVDYLGGLSPSISIQQKSASKNPRSTVGTITEIHDYLRVLFARIGQGHCPECGRPITAQSREQILSRVLALPEGSRILVLAPVIRGQKGEYKDLFQDMLKRGFLRARVDGELVRLSDDLKLDRKIKHNVEIVIDRLAIDAKVRSRLAEAVEQALLLGEGNVIISVEASEGRKRPVFEADAEPPDETRKQGADVPRSPDLLLSAHYACTHCNKSYEPPSPQLFSFNSPHGMCRDCDGLGSRYTFDPDLLIPDPSLSFYEGAIPLVGPLRGMGRWRKHIFEGVGQTLGIDLKKPWKKLPEEHCRLLLHGAGNTHVTFEWKMRGGGVWKHGGTWDGIVPQLLSSFKKTAAGPRRLHLEKYMRVVPCESCGGQRLNPQARAVRVGAKTLVDLEAMPLGDLAAWLDPETGPLEKSLQPVQRTIAAEVLKEIRARVSFLLNVGLHYLSLERSAPTLSGGESQRIRLAGQIGSGLVGVLYILDEPSIGLHPRDNDRLLRSLERLRDMGNTVLVVEHDEDTMRAADYIVDFGPGPGVRGGQVVAAGVYRDVLKNADSITGQYLSGKKQIAIPEKRRPPSGRAVKIVGARHNNLKNIDVEIPLGVFVCITGVSGSGKSSLINDVLREAALANSRLRFIDSDNGECDPRVATRGLTRDGVSPPVATGGAGATGGGDDADDQTPHRIGAHDRIDGLEHIDKVIDIDQSPIGRTPRSNPATYIKAFDQIRDLYAQLSEAKTRGYKPGRFSFNKPGGRCEACEGNGSNRLEMDFLADVWVKCAVCEGRRFNRETLQVRFKGKNIHDVLEMDVQEALEHFQNVPKIKTMLQTLHDVGLDYLKLGQPSPTLSGGEAQRIKLARELCRRSTGKTLYILDEPTTGLHFDDIEKLLRVLHDFVKGGNTVVVIEHNLDVVKTADWIIDLGPDGGAGGGRVVCTGTPETVAACETSHTGQALADLFSRGSKNRVDRRPAAKRVPSDNGRLTHLTVQGAQQHNLKNISVEIPRDQMTVCCGPSGSGKSSLAMDTIFAEGQRRYVESLSAYARQFLGQMQKPKVEHVSGLSPAISIEQQTTSKSPRSTVGTVTEIYDFLRILYARLGQPHCPSCQIPIGTQTADEIIEKIINLPEGKKLYLMAPIERRGQEKYEALFDEIRRSGFVRMRVNGKSYTVDDPPQIDHRRKHAVEVVVDRVIVRKAQRSRLADAVEAALELGKGVMHVAHVDDGREEPQWHVERFSQHFACDNCGRSFEPLNPHHFSFNSPLGWCPVCEGLGTQKGSNPALLLRETTRSLREGALAAWPDLTPQQPFTRFAEALARHAGFSLDTPFEKLTAEHRRAILYGTGDAWIALEDRLAARPRAGASAKRPKDASLTPSFQYKGVLPALSEAARVSFHYRHKLDDLVGDVPCSACNGARVREDAAACRFQKHTIGEVGAWPLRQTYEFFNNLGLSKDDQKIAGEVLREVKNRLKFLVDVGLDYVTLSRGTPTLSGGESQRIRLASQIGSGLTGVLYVLDEPTIGLHPRDNARLLQALQHLRDLGNTLILVEHDREVIAAADCLLDFGPGAGDRGGEITAQGKPARVAKSRTSLTGQYLSGTKAIAVPTNRRPAACGLAFAENSRNQRVVDASAKRQAALVVRGARQNNLKNIDVAFPLGCFVAVTGVSGSGKSSLVHEILYAALARKLHRANVVVGAHDNIDGLEQIDKVINVDQTPLGNSPSSNPATYTGVFDLIRQLFAQLPESRMRGWQAKRFSFNKPGGRCEVCEGNGQKKIEMHFLPDVWVECDTCQGSRYNPETLAVRYKGKNIADVLRMRVSEALELFTHIPKIRRIMQTLADVGLDYVALGQAAPTLSGGEAQRVKLAAELGRPNTGRTVYILDEPTTGLHFDDIRKLLDVLNRLVDLGNTVIVVEHNLDVIKTADWVIDMGPEAGEKGGTVVVAGTPEDVAHVSPPVATGGRTGATGGRVARAHGLPPVGLQVSHTARFLSAALDAGPYAERAKFDPHAAEKKKDGEVALEKVGQDAAMPWETDGRRWHVQDRLSHDGKPCRWEGDVLAGVEEQIHKLGEFAPTNWRQPTIVEITGPVKSQGWFFHAHTGMEWLIRLVFRVAKNTFRQEALDRQLGIPTLDNTPGLQVYGNQPRVKVANRKGPWQEVWMLIHRNSEIDTPGFRDFLKKAVQSFHANVKRMTTKPEDLMPWKVAGERWHLGEKGFPPTRKLRWDRAVLPRLIELVKSVDPDIEIQWDNRLYVTLRVKGVSRAWGQWKTKESEGLVCKFLGRKGQFNLSQLEQFGVEPHLTPHSAGEIMRLTFQHDNHVHATALKDVLRQHLEGFREIFVAAAV